MRKRLLAFGCWLLAGLPDNFTHHPSPITVACGDSVPPHVVNLIARKATVQKSDIRTVTYEGLNAQRDTVAITEQRVEIVEEQEEKESGGKPPNWTVIMIVVGSLLLLGIYITIKARP